MNKIFTYSWTGENTGWDYLIEFIPPSIVALDNPEVIELPAGSVDVTSLKSKFDKYPVSTGEIPELTVKFYLDDLHYQDFKEVLFLDPIEVEDFWKFELGLTCRLLIRYNKDSEPDVNIYRHVFLGSIKFESQTKIDIDNNELEVNFQLLEYVAFSQADFTAMEFTLFNYTTNNINYLIDAKKANEFMIIHFWNNVKFKMLSLYWLNKYINLAGKTIYEKLTRGYIPYQDITPPLPVFYKQLQDGSGGLGAKLTSDELYIVASVEKSGAKAGNFAVGDSEALRNKYKSIWEYLTELSECSLTKINTSHTLMRFEPTYYAWSDVTLHAFDFNKLSIIHRADILKKAQASFYGSLSDNEFKDLANWTESAVSSKNDNSFNLPITYNNMPICQVYEFVDSVILTHKNSSFRTDGIYYSNNDGTMSRVHEYADFYYNENYLTSSLPACAFVAEPWDDISKELPSQKVQKNQVSNNIGKCITKAYMDLFGDKKQVKCEVEADIDLGVSFRAGGDVGFVWIDTCTAFEINLTGYLPVEILSKFILTSYDVDFSSETVKAELITINK